MPVPPPFAPVVPRLRLAGICKAYAAVRANDEISLSLLPGEIHAVLGENGAGKSTLMKIIYGVTRADAGTIFWEGRAQRISSPAAARKLGIGMVFQHFSLFETLTVAENIALALDERTTPAALAPRITELSQRYGLPLDPQRPVHSLSVGERQRVEIVRCLLQSPRLLILDEPTSVLTPQAVLELFNTLRRLAAEGCSILYISHKLDEIQSLCDSATVLRGGRVAGSAVPRNESARSLAELMTGAELPECVLPPREAGEVRLRVQGLTLSAGEPFGTSLHDIALTVRSGEILGIAGISGNGQQELLRALSGETMIGQAGVIELMGRDVGSLDAGERRGLGLCFVPEERLGRGAVPAMSLADNALLTAWLPAARSGMVRRGLVQREVVEDFASAVIARFKGKCAGSGAAGASLSGGKLQKFIVGRETMLASEVMIVAQPTWGVDVAAALQIRQALVDLRERGVALLVISEELDELFTLCDRIAVLAGGRLSAALPLASTTPQQVGLWMGGSRAGQPEGSPHAAA